MTSLYNFTSENSGISLSLFFLPPFCSIHLPDLQFTPRSDPVTLLTLFPLLLLLLFFILLSHIAHSSLPLSPFLSLSGKSCDFSEAEPYKPAVLGGLSVYTALWLALAFRCCSLLGARTHTQQTPCFLLSGTNVILHVKKTERRGVCVCLCVSKCHHLQEKEYLDGAWLDFNEWVVLTRWNHLNMHTRTR